MANHGVLQVQMITFNAYSWRRLQGLGRAICSTLPQLQPFSLFQSEFTSPGICLYAAGGRAVLLNSSLRSIRLLPATPEQHCSFRIASVNLLNCFQTRKNNGISGAKSPMKSGIQCHFPYWKSEHCSKPFYHLLINYSVPTQGKKNNFLNDFPLISY